MEHTRRAFLRTTAAVGLGATAPDLGGTVGGWDLIQGWRFFMSRVFLVPSCRSPMGILQQPARSTHDSHNSIADPDKTVTTALTFVEQFTISRHGMD